MNSYITSENKQKIPTAYEIDYLIESLDAHWRGSGNMEVVRYHMEPILAKFPTCVLEYVIEHCMSATSPDDHATFRYMQETIAERHLLEK